MLARLSVNFRSRPDLIAFANHRFEALLGQPPSPDLLFDPGEGTVFHQPLEPGRPTDDAPNVTPPVHVLPLLPAADGDTNVDAFRDIEGQALAAYLRWLTGSSGITIADPLDGHRRPVRSGDVAVLAFSTFTLKFLFRHLDAQGVPYSSRGGRLFLSDPLHGQFLLGLRALADADDGVARAALMRPPFFAVTPADLLHALVDADAHHEGAARVRDARALVTELRRDRFTRCPGATARLLLERTAFGRHVALGPNGAQRLDRLGELCLQVGALAAREGLDFDGVTARTREWVKAPIQMDPPHPVGTDAVRVLTVHQAKGLEWPVVVLWDGCARLLDRERPLVWRTSHAGDGWTLKVDGLDWEDPESGDIAATETTFLNAERKRLVYVAGTRARDLLVIASPGKEPRYISAQLLEGAPEGLLHRMAPFTGDAGGLWADLTAIAATDTHASGGELERELEIMWADAAAAAATPVLAPRGIGSEAARLLEEEDGPPRPRPISRHGPEFGDTVHRAIGLVLTAQASSPVEAVARAAVTAGLDRLHDEAAADVGRAVEALRALGVAAPVGADVKLEYAVAGASGPGALLSGYADLVVAAAGSITVIDFKSDSPPAGDIADTHPVYVEQVRSYARLIHAAHPGARMRAALLFTADGQIAWVPA